MKIITKYFDRLYYIFPCELQITGSGTIDNPYLIEIIEKWKNGKVRKGNRSITFLDNHDYIKFIKINTRKLILKNSVNITISNATIRNIKLENCSNVSIDNSIISHYLQLSDVKRINISKCQIEYLYALTGDQILILDSNVKNISKNSKANVQFQE